MKLREQIPASMKFESIFSDFLWKSQVFTIWVGGAISPCWKMMEFVNGKDDIPYLMENKIHVWNILKPHNQWIIKHY